MPNATVFNFRSLSARASDWSSSAVGWKKNVTCTVSKPAAAMALAFSCNSSGRTALQHHAEADVVFRGFGAKEFRRAEAGGSCSDGAEEAPA